MSDALVLIGADAPDGPMAWVRVDRAGKAVEQGGVGVAPLPNIAPPRTFLVLPAADARLTRLELPARSQAQAAAAAEMLMRGALASGEALHFAVGAAQDREGRRLVAALSPARMRAWLERCNAAGADPHIVMLDCTVWPAPDETVVAAVTTNRAIIAAGPLGGFSIEPALAAPLLARWMEEAGASEARVQVLGGDPAAFRQALGRDVEAAPLPEPLATLAEGAVASSDQAPNLRQGIFAAAGREQQPFKLWRFAALLLVAAVMLQVGSLVVSGWRDQQAAAQIMDAAERDFRAARPDVQRVVNLRAQVTALSNAMEQAQRQPVLAASESLIQALRQQPLVRVDEIRHEAPARTVRLVVSAPQAAHLEAFGAHLREQGLDVSARDVRPRDGRHAAELTLEAP